MIHFYAPANQEIGIRDYLDVHGAVLRDELRILHYEDLPEQKRFSRGTYVLSALDQLSAPMTSLLLEIHTQLKNSDEFSFLNNPKTTLQRYELLSELNRRGLNEFSAVRATDDLGKLRFPVFLRHERLHEGAISPLLRSVSEIQQAIGRALVQGHDLRDLIVIEFCETANEAGFYRKYAAFVVGKTIIPRSLNYGRSWMLKHSGTEFTKPIVLEELEYVSSNPHEKQLREIFKVAHVQYGRIDYSIKDGRVQTWEINLNPTIGRGLRPPSRRIAPELDAVRGQVRSCFFRGFTKAWKENNLSSKSTPIELRIEPDVINAARMNVAHRRRLLTATRTILRPVKPLIEPLTPPFLFLFGWLSRLGHRQS